MSIDELIKAIGKHVHVLNELFDLHGLTVTFDDDSMESARAEMAELLDRTVPGAQEQSHRAELHGKFLGWDCLNSSEGHCVYNDLRDPSHDQCVVCGQPEERK